MVPHIRPMRRAAASGKTVFGDRGARTREAVWPSTESHAFVPSQPAATSCHAPGRGFTGTETRGSGRPSTFTKKLNCAPSFGPSTRRMYEPSAFASPRVRIACSPASAGSASNRTRAEIRSPGRRSSRGSSTPQTTFVCAFSRMSAASAGHQPATAQSPTTKSVAFVFMIQDSDDLWIGNGD